MVDYIMVDSNVHENVIYFKVMPLTLIYQIIVKLKLN